jgi:ABC-type transport system involved in cytochrome bd biosynthesis fused ATPase/permease subunit
MIDKIHEDIKYEIDDEIMMIICVPVGVLGFLALLVLLIGGFIENQTWAKITGWISLAVLLMPLDIYLKYCYWQEEKNQTKNNLRLLIFIPYLFVSYYIFYFVYNLLYKWPIKLFNYYRKLDD